MKKLNITKEHFENSRYFTKKYGTLEYVSESGKVFKTSKSKLLKFSESMHPVLSNEELKRIFEYSDDPINEFIQKSKRRFALVAENDDKDIVLCVQSFGALSWLTVIHREKKAIVIYEKAKAEVWDEIFVYDGHPESEIRRLCERYELHIVKSKLKLGDEFKDLVRESYNQEIDVAFKNGVHSCAEEINNGIKKILEYYTMPSYNYQSEAFKTAFEEIIPFKHNIEAILKLTES